MAIVTNSEAIVTKTGKLQEAVDHLVRAPFVSGLLWCHVDEFLGYLHLDFSAHRVEPRPP